MSKVYLIITTSTREFDVETNVEVYGSKASAKQAFKETKHEILELAKSFFNKIGRSDSDTCEGAKEIGKNFYGIHRSWSAAEWEETVSLQEKEVM